MTGPDLKAALAAGRTRPSLVLALVSEGYSTSDAWLMVRAAEIARLSEQLVALAIGAPANEEQHAADEARRLTLSLKLSVEAEELLTLATAASPAAPPCQPPARVALAG